MRRSSFDFIDWMKAIGMSLIVVGHVAGSLINDLTPPIYPKQLGVAFFLFAMGFSLARERRPRWEVVRNRLFEVYLFGLACALLLTGIAYATSGALYASNYLPFLGGANVVFNNFPVNPTTWYIGTYLHFLLLWAFVLREVRVTPLTIGLAIVCEIVVRAALVTNLGGFVGYMMMPNWISVFLFGMWYGHRPDARQTDRVPQLVLTLATIAALAVAWAVLAPQIVAEQTIPFMRMGGGPTAFSAILTSACVSFLYLSYTWLTFQATSRVKANALVQLVARNTILVFIAHMPIYYFLDARLGAWTASRPLQLVIRVVVCLFGLVLASEVIRRAVRPKELRDWMFGRAHRVPPVKAVQPERMGAA